MTETETDSRPTVRLQPPPPKLMRIVNPLVRRVLTMAPFGRRMRRQAVLGFQGRRSGRSHRVPVCLFDVDGAVMVFTTRSWRFNFVDGAPVTVTHQGRRRRARATLLDTNPEQVGRAVRAALDNGAIPFQIGLKMPRNYNPTVAELAALPLRLIHVAFEEE